MVLSDDWKPGLLALSCLPLVAALQLAAVWVVGGIGQAADPPPTAAVPAPPVAAPPQAAAPPAPAAAPAPSPVVQALDGWRRERPAPAPAADPVPAPPQPPAAPEPAARAAEEVVERATAPLPALLRPAAQSASGAPVVLANAFTLDPVEPLEREQNPDDLQNAGWLRQRDPGHYTLQIITVSSPDNLDKFIEDQRLPEPRAYYRTFWSKRQTHAYALVVGSYPDWSAARKAARELSGRQPKLKPWVRSFGEIQREMQ